MPKNESLGLLRDAQSGATNGQMRQRAGEKMGEVGGSFRSATDSLMDTLRPRKPRIAGVDKNGQPLYENPLGFGPPVSKREYDDAQMALGMIGGGFPQGAGMMGGLARALPKRPSGSGGLQPVPSGPSPPRPSLPGNPQPRPSGPGPVAPRLTPQPSTSTTAMPAPTPPPRLTPQPATPQAPTGDPFANFGNQFKGIDYAEGIGELAKGYGRQAAKGLGATALVGSGIAGVAGAMSGREPQPADMPQAEPPPQSSGDYPTMMGAGIAAGAPYLKDAVGAGMSALRGLGEPQLPPEPLRASGRDKRRGVPVAGAQTATGAIQQATQQPAQQEQMQAAGNQSGGSGPGYWIDMLQAADTGDAYARDLVALREQARASAIAAAQRGDSQQFVPIMDYRGNKMHFVNAGGGDVVLDMNDEQDRNQYQRIIAKTGLPAEQVQQWASRTSSPLMGYFERGGGPRRPEFDRTPKPAMPQ